LLISLASAPPPPPSSLFLTPFEVSKGISGHQTYGRLHPSH
jgi:hypothetical protein